MTADQDQAGDEPLRAVVPRERIWLHGLLLLLTFFTMLIAGARDEIGGELGDLWQAPQLILRGLPYAGALLAILVAHEMGHYLVARKNGVDQSLPFFIPAPTLFGTMGAVIFMRKLPRNRRQLFDVAVTGPIAGLVLAIPATIVGLMWSQPIEAGQLPASNVALGSSLLFQVLIQVLKPEAAETGVMLHPLAFAGWTGMFVTSLNLIPVGQLDGGHLLYALLGRRQVAVSAFVLLALLAIGVLFRSPVWVVWVMILVLLGFRHPPVSELEPSLGPGRWVIGVIMLIVFLATFTVVPAGVPVSP